MTAPISYRLFLSWMLVLGLLMSCSFSFGQTAKASLDREQIKIGEQITLSLMLEAPANAQIVWPQLPDTLSKTVEIVQKGGIDTVSGSFHQDLIITSFDSGYHAIAPIIFQVDGQMFQTEPLLIGVQTVEVDSANSIVDIKSIMGVEVSYWDIFKEWLGRNWPYVAGGLGFFILLIIGLFLLIKRNERKVLAPQPPPQPAHIIAMRKLTDLEGKNLWQGDKIKLYYIELTEIIREYLENRYRIYALELTTDEILQNLLSSDLPKAAKEELGKLLRLSDLVKFAKHLPLPSENSRSIDDARKFVDETKLVEKPKEEVETDTTSA